MKHKKAKDFEILNHTADIRLKVKGSSLKELFQNAAKGMFSSVVSLEAIKKNKSISVELGALSKEDLLIDWLNELLFQSQTKRMLFGEFLIEKITPTHLKAKVWGEKIDKKRHHLKSEIKAATYHELLIEQDKNGWWTYIIFDV